MTSQRSRVRSPLGLQVRWRTGTRIEAAFVVLTTSLVLCLLLPRALIDAWVSLFWPTTTAVIVGEPVRGPPGGRRGPPFTVQLQATLSDNREVEGQALRPLYLRRGTPNTPEALRYVPPRAGDRLLVHFRPSAPERMVPHEELLCLFCLLPVVLFVTSVFLCVGLNDLFRRRVDEAADSAESSV